MNKTGKLHYHLIGVGGIGMSCIAQLLLRQGVSVSGSDIRENKVTDELKRLGAHIHIGHASENVHRADVVIYSSAIKDDNPELSWAKHNGLALMRRAEALAGLMRNKTVVTVAGSHGKTTTTSLVSYLFLEAGMQPSVAVGGIIKNIDTNACLGSGNYFVAEADESDGTFLCYQPTYSLITNIDKEHMDYYGSMDQQICAFEQFMLKTKPNGCIIYCSDNLILKSLAEKITNRRLISFGLVEPADYYPSNIVFQGLSSEFDCMYRGVLVGRFALSLGGMHNVSNALSVIALARELSIDLSVVGNALRTYQGARRRLDVKCETDSLMVIDDYAHHPTEITATLAAVKTLGRKRIIAVFQPHRYTRTLSLMEELSTCFNDADTVFITDIYAASEHPIAGVDALALCQKIHNYDPTKHVRYCGRTELVSAVSKEISHGDVVITLGAGDITKVSDELAEISALAQ